MTRKQFINKIRGFNWLAKRKLDHEFGEAVLEEAAFKFYAQHRAVPVFFIEGMTFGMELPKGYDREKAMSIRRGMPDSF